IRVEDSVWGRVGKVVGSSWSGGGVVKNGEEGAAGLAGDLFVNSGCLNCGGRQDTDL
nr:hypothetical protein [Tanacetum cinerariifolium]